jgi:geranylgeranyl pyrophosphate synthase
MKDDFIDWIDKEKQIGKRPFNDILRKKKRLPLLLAYESSSRRERRQLNALLRQRITEGLVRERVLNLVITENVLADAKKLFLQREERTMKLVSQASSFLPAETIRKITQLVHMAAAF